MSPNPLNSDHTGKSAKAAREMRKKSLSSRHWDDEICAIIGEIATTTEPGEP